MSAQLGARVAVAELPFAAISSDSTGGVGGTCVLRGCVPKKLLVYGSQFTRDFEACRGFGWDLPGGAPRHDWPALIAAKTKELERLRGVYLSILDKAGVQLIEGRATIVDPHTVEVNGKRLTARHIMVAVGGRATVPDVPGREHVITSDEALDLPQRPAKICIIGAGYIALEFACIFNGLGSEVHLYIRGDKILRGFDEEIRDFLTAQLEAIGIHFHFKVTPTAVEKAADGKLALVTDKERNECDAVMYATGRNPNTKNLGLEAIGIELTKKGAIPVDEYSRTKVPSVWAIGDVTDRIALTPVALMEGMNFAKTAFGDEPSKADHVNVPSAVFTQPPIGTVGPTEDQAIEKYGNIDVYTSEFKPMKATLSGMPEKIFVKLIVDANTDKVVALHVCGDEGPEILQGFAVAIKAGLTKKQVDATIGIHPTTAEELVTMREPKRKIRKKAEQQAQREKEQVAA
eukprot:SM000072S21229  [mRNA]  locus=s72:450199:452673:- [translate_table: standard]